MDEPWVNAVIEVTVPLNPSVRPGDLPEVKQEAVAAAMSSLLASLPEEFEGAVASASWEDVTNDD